MELINKTPFSAARAVLQDRHGRDLLVVVVKQTFELSRGVPRPAEEQVPVTLADTFHGEPGESSVEFENDFAPVKPGTDVVLVGHAYAPGGRTKEMDVELRVGPVGKTVRVFGDRRWSKTLGRLGTPSPEAFERMPLIYERAFGGSDHSADDEKDHDQERRNSVGCGFIARKSKLDAGEVPLPNLEDPKDLIKGGKDRPAPCGFGFYGRSWEPRLSLAGTYDDAWLASRSPLLPDDFDERYHNGASPGLVAAPHLSGGEPVLVSGASPRGELRFDLPRRAPRVRAMTRTEKFAWPQPRFDTLVLDPDRDRFTMTWRATADVHGNLTEIDMIQVFADA